MQLEGRVFASGEGRSIAGDPGSGFCWVSNQANAGKCCHSTCSLLSLLPSLFFSLFPLRGSLMQDRLPLNSICIQGWPWILDPPASTSWVLGVQHWATVLGFRWLCTWGKRSSNWVSSVPLVSHFSFSSGPRVMELVSSTFWVSFPCSVKPFQKYPHRYFDLYSALIPNPAYLAMKINHCNHYGK